jgi:3',5'-cyclic AMP phosphodiesterase CpdA
VKEDNGMMFRNRFFTAMMVMSALVVSFGILGGCGDNATQQPQTTARFAVFSDPHLYDGAKLGTSGVEFQTYLAGDRKMLVESSEILTSVINDLKSKPLDFVLVTGDLTKDGEEVNHLMMAARLTELKATGKKVYVIPGNHDINNPHAVSYLTSPTKLVAKVSPFEFKQIYADFGYRDAIASDPNSLSYIVEPVPGLWLFALDSCKYDNNLNQTAPTTSGEFKPQTLTWILDRVSEAKSKGKTIIGMMHHGILEHYTGQTSLFPEYVLNDYTTVSKQLSDSGLNIMFTGHFHANDVTRSDFGSSVLHDIETGSTVTAPSPYRTVDLDMSAKTLAIKTSTVTSIPSHLNDFVAYSRQYLNDGLTTITPIMLKNAFGLTDVQLSSLTPVMPFIVNGFMAHYAGNETPDVLTQGTYTAMMQSPDMLTAMLGQSIAAIWTDKSPSDNNVTITINSTK